jgi:Spy/CpxP family protein refolding chaperone
MREVLTLEQRQEFASIMDEKKANFRRRRDNRE